MHFMEKLSFADVVYSSDFVVEIIPHAGIEISDWHVREYTHFIDQLNRPIGILLNRINGYSYTFGSLQKMIDHPLVTAVAILATERYTYTISEVDISFVLTKNKPLDVFYNKLIATLWFNMLRLRLPNEPDNFTGRNCDEPQPLHVEKRAPSLASNFLKTN